MQQYAIGTDAIAIHRFIPWTSYSPVHLRKIFSQHEIDYCFKTPCKTAERLAARFAAREAFFKALHTLLPTIKIPLLTVIKNVSVAHAHNGAPQLVIDWHALNVATLHTEKIGISLSLTHTHDIAWATVLLWINSATTCAVQR